jgi:3-hydroxyisobutyrate dehydrogenase-like beta-hydroxyacid dehydrogenase
MAGPDIKKVAFFGLGIMGWPMAANLAKAGFDVSVWTHSEGKAERFASENGARAAATPREAAEGADAAITMVVDAAQVKEVLLGDTHGAQARGRRSRSPTGRSSWTCPRSRRRR